MNTFRPQFQYWSFQIFGALCGLFFFVFGLNYLIPGWGWVIGMIFWLIVCVLDFFLDTLPMIRTRLVISEDGLTSRANKELYDVKWGDIIAANLFQDNGKQSNFIWIATNEAEYTVPLKYLDAQEIWKQVQLYVEPAKLGYKAHQSWLAENEDYQIFTKNNAEIIQTLGKPLIARPPVWFSIFGWFGLIFFGFLTTLSLSTEYCWFLAIFFVGFGMLTGLMLLPDRIEMDAGNISRVIWPFGRYRIRWDEIELIEFCGNFEWLVVYGNKKRLPMWGPGYWRHEGRKEASEFLQAQIEQRKIFIQFNKWVYFICLPKRCRI